MRRLPHPRLFGQDQPYRLNRGGDRRGNNALFTIVLVRMRHDPATRAYVARRTAEGKNPKEIMRCLKRFAAREVYQALINPPQDLPTGHELIQLRLEAGHSLTTVSNARAPARSGSPPSKPAWRTTPRLPAEFVPGFSKMRLDIYRGFARLWQVAFATDICDDHSAVVANGHLGTMALA